MVLEFLELPLGGYPLTQSLRSRIDQVPEKLLTFNLLLVFEGAPNGSPWGEIMAIDTVSQNTLNTIKKFDFFSLNFK